jgi:hypothetical protein
MAAGMVALTRTFRAATLSMAILGTTGTGVFGTLIGWAMRFSAVMAGVATSVGAAFAPLLPLLAVGTAFYKSAQAIEEALPTTKEGLNSSITGGQGSILQNLLRGSPKSSQQPIQVNATLEVDNEVLAQSITKSSVIEDKIDDRISFAQ